MLNCQFCCDSALNASPEYFLIFWLLRFSAAPYYLITCKLLKYEISSASAKIIALVGEDKVRVREGEGRDWITVRKFDIFGSEGVSECNDDVVRASAIAIPDKQVSLVRRAQMRRLPTSTYHCVLLLLIALQGFGPALAISENSVSAREYSVIFLPYLISSRRLTEVLRWSLFLNIYPSIFISAHQF